MLDPDYLNEYLPFPNDQEWENLWFLSSADAMLHNDSNTAQKMS